MSQTPLLIHIGYHKTATTWMQRALFVPEFGYRPLMDHDEVFAMISGAHDLRFDPSVAQGWIAEKSAGLEEAAVAVISSEILTGNMFFGGRESLVLAQRLKTIAPDAKILITIRAQPKILPSVYMQYLLRGGTLSPSDFFTGKPALGYTPFDPDHFAYHRLHKVYCELFGVENVLVSTQEGLAKDRAAVARQIADFSGNALTPEGAAPEVEAQGVSFPEYAVPVLRRISHLQGGPVKSSREFTPHSRPGHIYRWSGSLIRRLPTHNMLKGRKPVADYVKQQFEGYYDSSNNALAAQITHPIDLSAYPSIS